MGPIGILAGAGAGLLFWLQSEELVDALKKDRERRERGEPQFKPLELLFVIGLMGLLLYACVGMVLDRAN